MKLIKTNSLIIGIISFVVASLITSVVVLTVFLPKPHTNVIDNSFQNELASELAKIKEQEERDNALGQYAINMMYQTAKSRKFSDAKKQTLARSLVRVTNDVFENLEHKKAFIAVIAIESEFQKYAQSPTGPRGLSQVSKAAFNEGLAKCGVTNVNDEDVWETDINLYAGACYFRSVLEMHNGDPYIAIVAYNQGPNSADIKKFSQFGILNTTEALKYVARFTFLKRTVTEQKAPNVPDIKEMSIPAKK
jgi:soluble lytic murein transglycosylase-like protein